jgi:hypothetical protein
MGILNGVLGTVGWLGAMLLMVFASGHSLRPAPTEPHALVA